MWGGGGGVLVTLGAHSPLVTHRHPCPHAFMLQSERQELVQELTRCIREPFFVFVASAAYQVRTRRRRVCRVFLIHEAALRQRTGGGGGGAGPAHVGTRVGEGVSVYVYVRGMAACAR